MTNFNGAAFQPGRVRQLHQTENFIVNEEITGGMLHKAFGIDQPYMLNTNYAQIFAASNRYFGKPMIGMLDAKGKTIEIPASTYRFKLSGGTLQKARVTAVVCTDPKPGLNLTSFKVVFDKPYFTASDIIHASRNYRCRVMANPVDYAGKSYKYIGPNQYEYTLRLTTDSSSAYIEPRYIQQQVEWMLVSSAVADTDNREGGGFSFYSTFEAQGHVQQHAKKLAFQDKTLRLLKEAAERNDYSNPSALQGYNRWLWTPLKNSSSGEIKQFGVSLLEAEMRDKLYQDCENTLVYGQESTQSLYSQEGHVIRTAAGLLQQLEYGNVLEHTGNMTLRELEEWFDMQLKDRVDVDKQKIVMSCGRQFAKMFDRMVKNDSATFLTLDTKFIRQGDSFKHLDYGSYYTHFEGFTVSFDVMMNPAYDSQHLCPDMHPQYPGYTIDSWRADILDMGGLQSGTDSTGLAENMLMISEKYMNYHIVTEGKWKHNPFTANYDNTGMPITDGGLGNPGAISGFTVLMEKSAGLLVKDPTRCSTIRLSDDIRAAGAI